MSRRINALVKFIGAITVTLVILSVISLVYCYTGVKVFSQSGATDYTWDSGQWKSNMMEGFAWLFMDSNGYNNPEAISADEVDILLMGSSHMEALQVPADKNMAYLLSESMKNKNVYNVGISGHTIYRCISNFQEAVSTYDSVDCIIIETDTVSLNAEEMNTVINGVDEPIPSFDSGLLYSIQKNIPALKTLYKQVVDWRQMSSLQEREIVKNDTSNRTDQYECILNDFLRLLVEAKDDDMEVIIFYHPPVSIDMSGSYVDTTNLDDKALFQQICIDKGIIFVDMTEDFEKVYEERKVLAKGFVNTGVGEGHLNEYGHEIICRRLTEVMEKRVYVNH